MKNVFFVFLIIGVPFIVFMAGYFPFRKRLIKSFYNLKSNIILKKAPILQSTVTVVSKSIDIIESLGGPGTFSGKITKTFYAVCFDFPNRNKKTFELDMYQYRSISEDEIGILTYKEKGKNRVFISFKRGS